MDDGDSSSGWIDIAKRYDAPAPRSPDGLTAKPEDSAESCKTAVITLGEYMAKRGTRRPKVLFRSYTSSCVPGQTGTESVLLGRMKTSSILFQLTHGAT